MSDMPAPARASSHTMVHRPQSALSVRSRIALVLVVAILIAVRMPEILLQGRFWAEDGVVFFSNAWRLSWPRALLATYGGYLNLTANMGGVLAWHVVPLAWAPYAPTVLGWLFQLCPAIFLVTAGAPWLERRLIMVGALLLVTTPPASEEVWMTGIGAQFHLALSAALILAVAPKGGWLGLFRLVLLALAALSGPASWLLTPLFAIRAVLERSLRRILQAAVLGIGVLIQVAFFYSHEPGRTYAVRPLLFLDIAFARHILVPFLGPGFAAPIALEIRKSVLLGNVPVWPAAALAVIGIAATIALAPTWREGPLWLALAAGTLAAVSYIGALGNVTNLLYVANGERYAFVPQVLVALALLGSAATRRGWVAAVCGGCAVWLTAVGALTYFAPAPGYADGPSWRSELLAQQRDPTHAMASWPPGVTVPPPGLQAAP